MLEFDEAMVSALSRQRATASATARLEEYVARLQPRPGEQVLDVGCGSGEFCRLAGQRVAPGGRVIGVDISPAAVELAARLTDPAILAGVAFQVGDGYGLPFDDGSFDAAACISVLALCEDPVRVLRELGRVLRPGGRLLVANSDEDTRIFGGCDHELGRRMNRLIADRTRAPWLARRLAHLLRSAGFGEVQQESLISVERRFAPDTAGYVLAHAMADHLARVGVTAGDYRRWLADLEQADREGAYCYSVLTHVYRARR